MYDILKTYCYKNIKCCIDSYMATYTRRYKYY